MPFVESPDALLGTPLGAGENRHSHLACGSILATIGRLDNRSRNAFSTLFFQRRLWLTDGPCLLVVPISNRIDAGGARQDWR
jgi:hypothetical protein